MSTLSQLSLLSSLFTERCLAFSCWGRGTRATASAMINLPTLCSVRATKEEILGNKERDRGEGVTGLGVL